MTATSVDLVQLPEQATAKPARLAPAVVATRPSRLRVAGPLALVVLIQSLLTLRRGGSALGLEAASLAAGRHALVSPVTGWLLGARWIYPSFARALLSFGGLELVRGASCLFAVAATLFVFSFCRQLLGDLAGVLAALVFGVSVPVLALGHLSVADSLALVLVTAGARLTIADNGSDRAASLLPAVAGGALSMSAVITSFAALSTLPVLLLVATGWTAARASDSSGHRRADWAGWRPVAFAGGMAAILLAATMADAQLLAAMSDPFRHFGGAGIPLGQILLRFFETVGPVLAIATVGLVLVGRQWHRSPGAMIAAALLSSAACTLAYQLGTHSVSGLAENEGFSMIFLAPLAGACMAGVLRLGRLRAVLPVLGTAAVLVCFSAGTVARAVAWSDTASGSRPTGGGTSAGAPVGPSLLNVRRELGVRHHLHNWGDARR